MMIHSSSRGEIVRMSSYQDRPEGAVPISSEEVLTYQLERIQNWDPQSEVRSLKNGPGICTTASIITCLFTNHHFRQHFNLRHYGRASGYMITICTPAIITFLVHSNFITRKVLLADFTCPTCLVTQSGIYQALSGAIYPTLISPIFCLLQAKKYLTSAIEPTNRIGDTVKVIARTTIPFKGFLLISVMANMAIGMYMTRLEIDTFLNVLMKKDKKEDLE